MPNYTTPSYNNPIKTSAQRYQKLHNYIFAKQDIDLANRFAEQSVFVTGADGFAGSHLTEQLVEFGADVHAFARASSNSELQNIRHLRDDITLHWGDIHNKHSVMSALEHLVSHFDTII